jgi:IS30 family transposase
VAFHFERDSPASPDGARARGTKLLLKLDSVADEKLAESEFARQREALRLSRELTRRLRTGRPLRKRRRRALQRRARFVVPALLIDHRPPVVADRVRIGDWEAT